MIRKLSHPVIWIALLLVSYLLTQTANIDYDAATYINFDSTRPPLYPFFIWLFQSAGNYQFTLIIWTHALLLFAALCYARYWLKKNLQVTDFPIFMVCLFVIVSIGMHFQIKLIQSEGLAFPLFIGVFFLLIDCFKGFNRNKIIYLAIGVSLLVLMRLQFIYFYGLFAILCIWYFWQRIPKDAIKKTTMILFGSMVLTSLIDHSYHYLKHGFFASSVDTNVSMLVQTLYLADDNAANYIQNPVAKQSVQEIIAARNDLNLNQDAELVQTLKPSGLELAYQAYVRNYQPLTQLIETRFHHNIESDDLAKEVNKAIFAHETQRNAVFFVWKFIQCMGGIPILISYLMILFIVAYQVLRDRLREPAVPVLFLAVTTLLTIGNAAIISICNPDLPVYFCYSQFMFYCMAAYLVSRA